MRCKPDTNLSHMQYNTMPKTKKAMVSDPVVRAHGHFRTQVTGAVTIISFPVSVLSLDQRLSDLSDSFSEYRFTKIKAKLWNGVITIDVAITYTPTLLTVTPTYAQLTSLPLYATGNGQFGSPNPTINISRRELTASGPKWFRRGTPFDDLFEIQGQIWVGCVTTFNATPAVLHLEYDVELKASADIALTAAQVPRSALQTLEMVSGCESRSQAGMPEEKDDDLVLVPRHFLHGDALASAARTTRANDRGPGQTGPRDAAGRGSQPSLRAQPGEAGGQPMT